jgi:hypothetical protein
MEDSSPSTPVRGRGRAPRSHKMEVKVSGDSLLMDFNSDSDDEDVTGTKSEVCPSVPRPPGYESGVRSSGTSDIFSDGDEDDFCIVNTPTSTKVVRWDGNGCGIVTSLWCHCDRHLEQNPRSNVCLVKERHWILLRTILPFL